VVINKSLTAWLYVKDWVISVADAKAATMNTDSQILSLRHCAYSHRQDRQPLSPASWPISLPSLSKSFLQAREGYC
jgi:hypothetical protein